MWPRVVAVVPARDESEFIGETIGSVLGQRYPGSLSVYLVDDRSSDGTADVAREAAQRVKGCPSFRVVTARERPEGWAGKVWALDQGVEAASGEEHEYFWFTDADIGHSPDVLTGLMAKAEREGLDLVSVMASLHVSTFWDKHLIPAFVFFFGKLYPFRWVNDHGRGTAAAAGGCVLVRKERLVRAGGLAVMRDAIIDDCALARLVRGPRGEGKLWLGLSQDVRSIRPYGGLRGIWDMVARTAYVQLRRSPVVLAGDSFGDGLALSRCSGVGGGRDWVVGGWGRGCGDLGDAGVGASRVGADGRGICADVEVVRAKERVGGAASGVGAAVHADDGGFRVAELEGSGWGVEGTDILREAGG